MRRGIEDIGKRIEDGCAGQVCARHFRCFRESKDKKFKAHVL